MAPDGSDTINLTNDPGDDFAPAWSPDGSQVAFVSNRENDQGGGQFIYVMNADGSGVRPLTIESDSNYPDWSHDGSRIAYTDQGDLYVIHADGSGQPVKLTDSPDEDTRPRWSLDDSQIAWLSGRDGNRDIFVMNADGSNIRQLTQDGRVYDAEWTVDGRIFTHWENQEAGCFNCLMDADGSKVVDAGGKGEIQRYLPFWTADGHRVELSNADLFTGDNEIYLVGNIFPDMFLNLTNHPADDRNPDWPANCGPGAEAASLEIGQGKGQDEIVIGYAGDDENQQQRRGNFQKACDELGIRCIYGGVSELIAQGADAIVQNTKNGSAQGLRQELQNAVEQGIPVFLLDAELDMDGVYSITIDQREWAKISLKWMFEKAGGEGQIVYFDVFPDYNHVEAINEMLSQYPGVSVAEKGGGKDFDPNWVKPMTADFVKAHPGLKAVWTNGNMEGAIQGVVEESGAPQEQWPSMICEASTHGLGVWMRARSAYPNFDCIAVGNPAGIAYDAVYAAYTLLSGAEINATVLGGRYGHSLFVDIPVVTGDNLQEWLQTNPAVDQMMTPEEIREAWFVE